MLVRNARPSTEVDLTIEGGSRRRMATYEIFGQSYDNRISSTSRYDTYFHNTGDGRSSYLIKCFAEFITHMEGEGNSRMPRMAASSAAMGPAFRAKYAWMRVLTVPWVSQRERVMKKLEKVIWIDSFLQCSKQYHALCGFPLVMLSSALLERNEMNWFLSLFYNSSLVFGYLCPVHVLVEKFLVWFCKRYVMPAIREDFFRLELLDETTYCLFSYENRLPNQENTEVQHEADDLRSNASESTMNNPEQEIPIWPTYERIRILSELLSDSGKKLDFQAIIRNAETLRQGNTSERNRSALPVVDKSYILNKLNTALRLDWYTSGVILMPLILLPSHQMCILAYCYFILLEHYYHTSHLNVGDILEDCSNTVRLEWVHLTNVLTWLYDLPNV